MLTNSIKLALSEIDWCLFEMDIAAARQDQRANNISYKLYMRWRGIGETVAKVNREMLNAKG